LFAFAVVDPAVGAIGMQSTVYDAAECDVQYSKGDKENDFPEN
jgi:hypothetical protein